VLVACAPQPEPRTVLDFMDDGYAREGVLTRCNQNRDATLNDAECANARRAAAALALEAERARAAALAEQSEAKLLALRERVAVREATERDAAAAARAAAEAAYEASWRDPAGPRTGNAPAADAAPVFGAPLGPVMPSMTESTLFDVYADGRDALTRPAFEIEAAAPPSNELVIDAPSLDIAELAVVPRPFRDAATPQ
jgi:hypothetical protein